MPRQMNIHQRLALVLWGAALFALLVTGSGFALFQSLTLEHRVRQIMEPYAQLVAVGADAAVTFEDPVRAEEILVTLQANPQIQEADIFLDSGRVLASFRRTPGTAARFAPTKPDGVYLDRDTAELLQGLPRGARLRISMGLDQLKEQTHQAVWMLGAGMLVVLMATLGQLMVLRRTIVRPIASLTETTEHIRARADYAHRVPAAGTDEVARLGQSFNAMMDAIRAREDELRQLMEFQRTILDNAAYGIISSTPEGIVTSFNPAAERLLGYAAGDVVGKLTPERWHDPEEMARRARELSEELGEPVAAGFEVFQARPRAGLAEEREWTFIRKDGQRIPVLLSVSALRGGDGEITGYVGLTHDLTERKKAERQVALLSFALNHVHEVSCLVDEHARILYVNDESSRVLGYGAEEQLRMTLMDIGPDWTIERWNRHWRELREKGTVTREDVLRRKDGSVFPVEFNANYFEYEGKAYSLSIARDITERKQAEAALRHLNETLAQQVREEVASNREKDHLLIQQSRLAAMGEMVHNIAHQWRQPLTALSVLLANIKDDYDYDALTPDILHKSVKDGQQLLQGMSTTIDDFRDFFRPDQTPAEFDMRQAVEDALFVMEASLKNNFIEVERDMPTGLTAFGYANQFAQVVLNILANAKEAISNRMASDGRIKVALRLRDGNGFLTIEDNGGGIPPDILPKIFDPYFTTKEKGSGIGLYMSKMIVERNLNGKIEAGNADHGAVIGITLPLSSHADPAGEPAA